MREPSIKMAPGKTEMVLEFQGAYGPGKVLELDLGTKKIVELSKS